MKKQILFFLAILLTIPVFGQPMSVRLKDISRIIEARDNQLLGFGLVVGLRNTGDSKNTAFTDQALVNMLQKMGITADQKSLNSRNVASVIVTGTLPPFVKKGQRIPVTVSSLGDSTSLVGGTLLLTPLQGPDGEVYAVGQGSVIVGGISESTALSKYYKNQTTVGRIPEGAIVEKEVEISFYDQHNITIVLNDTDFVTIARAVEAIKLGGYEGVNAIDANTIKVPLADIQSKDLISAIAEIGNIMVVPDSTAKVVINSRTGTVVIGEMVRLFPVALTHGAISIRISESGDLGNAFAAPGGEASQPVNVVEAPSRVLYLNPNATLNSLVDALNEIGATPKDMISIIQALKEAKALIATIEII